MGDTCFLDMDGILADFVGGACRAHGRDNPYTMDNPQSWGVFDLEKVWGITPEQFWAPCDGESFWDDLEEMPDAQQLYNLAVRTFGLENIAVLTSPSQSPYCVPGKRRWLKKHFPELVKKVIFTGAKGFLAGSGRYLIDDRDRNVTEFNQYGGTGILVPRMWNSRFSCAGASVSRVVVDLRRECARQ